MNPISQNSRFFTLRHLALLALLVAICVAARLSFTWLPNFTPVTTLILLICFYWGLADALIVANTMLLATAIYLGIGFWVFEQMLAYSLILSNYFFLTKIKFLQKLFSQMLLAFLAGLVYGFIMAVGDVFLFKISTFWAYYGAGLPFDLMHASGNFLFMFFLKKPFEILKTRLL